MPWEPFISENSRGPNRVWHCRVEGLSLEEEEPLSLQESWCQDSLPEKMVMKIVM